jgi:cellulose synthase/poly-beta-1,6-N-acetylglucosamine synthase-like glycosyltransferase
LANLIIVLFVSFYWVLILDALAWLSTVLILGLSAYSIRSVIFIYMVTRARANNNLDNMPKKIGAIIPSTASKTVTLHEQGVIADRCGDIGVVNRTSGQQIYEEYPFISIFVATHNESPVIERLLKSFAALSYPTDRFEIIIVDDSTDDTYQKIQTRLSDLQNLKVIHRDNRAGWKGGALNVALDAMDKRASNVLVLDADNILLVDTVERFVSRFIEEQYSYREKRFSVLAIQGFPISKNNPEADNESGIKVKLGNWIARAIDFRLSQRNLIEFTAKDLLNLPVQITGSLFMIRADVIKSIKFSNDLCEDWDLTVDLYCSQRSSSLSSPTDVITSDSNAEPIFNHASNTIFTNPVAISLKPKVIFDQELVSYCEATTDLAAYFRQRMRVSEGHTRGLRRKFRHITENNMLSLVDKVELFLIGLQYAKFIFVLGIGIINMTLILMFLSSSYNNSQQFLMNLIGISFSLQAANLAIAIARIIWAAKICRPVRRYDIEDVLSLMALNVITTPAFVIGSLRGFFKDKGIFYKTRRNLAKESKLSKPSVLSESTKSSPSYTGP